MPPRNRFSQSLFTESRSAAIAERREQAPLPVRSRRRPAGSARREHVGREIYEPSYLYIVPRFATRAGHLSDVMARDWTAIGRRSDGGRTPNGNYGGGPERERNCPNRQDRNYPSRSLVGGYISAAGDTGKRADGGRMDGRTDGRTDGKTGERQRQILISRWYRMHLSSCALPQVTGVRRPASRPAGQSTLFDVEILICQRGP